MFKKFIQEIKEKFKKKYDKAKDKFVEIKIRDNTYTSLEMGKTKGNFRIAQFCYDYFKKSVLVDNTENKIYLIIKKKG